MGGTPRFYSTRRQGIIITKGILKGDIEKLKEKYFPEAQALKRISTREIPKIFLFGVKCVENQSFTIGFLQKIKKEVVVRLVTPSREKKRAVLNAWW